MSLTIKKSENGVKMSVTDLAWGKVPPQAPELEDVLLGACMLESDSLSRVMGVISKGDCFYQDAHQKIYDTILSMVISGFPIDMLTVGEQLSKKGELEIVGGNYYLAQLTNKVHSHANIDAYAKIVMEKFFGREIIRVCGMVISEVYEDSADIFEILESVKHDIDSITKDIDSGGDATVGALYMHVLKELEYQKDNKTALTGIDTGLFDLNQITNGWQKTDLIIIGARPSKGKTALALNLALSAAISTLVQKVPVGIFSLEMGAAQLVKRMASTVTGINFGKIISGNLTDEEFVQISQKSRYFHSLPIYIADRVYSLQKLSAKARKWKDKHDIGLLVIDYLQLIKSIRQQGGNREQEISSITRDLKILAKELEIPVILLSQLNRQVEGRGSPEPTPADLRESGAIEQDADVILFPWHGENESFISVAKNRNGQTAVKENALKIKFAGNIQKWMDPQAFEPFKEQYIPDNARAGIRNNYQPESEIKRIDEDAPF